MIVFTDLAYPAQRTQFCDLLSDFGIKAVPCEKAEQVMFLVPRWSGTREQFMDFLLWIGRRFELPTEEIRIIHFPNGLFREPLADADTVIREILAKRRARGGRR